jgi:hypothetical protein
MQEKPAPGDNRLMMNQTIPALDTKQALCQLVKCRSILMRFIDPGRDGELTQGFAGEIILIKIRQTVSLQANIQQAFIPLEQVQVQGHHLI